MKNLLFLTLFLVLTFSLKAQETSPSFGFRIQAGFGQFTTFDDFADFITISEGNRVGSSNGNLAKALFGPSVGMGLSYLVTPRWTAQANLNYFYQEGTYTDFTRWSSLSTPQTIVIESDRELSVFNFSALMLYDLASHEKFAVKIGTGISWMARAHRYRTYTEVDYDLSPNNIYLVERYETIKKKRFGIPAQITASYQINPQWTIGTTGNLSLFFNEDVQITTSLEVGYWF